MLEHRFLTIYLFSVCHPYQGLGTPKGMRFSDVTDTSATVHWTLPQTHVDSYRVTYVPIQGGKWRNRGFSSYFLNRLQFKSLYSIYIKTN